MKKLTATEILNKIDKRVKHLNELDIIREERKELNCSSKKQKMKKENKIGKNPNEIQK